MTRRRTEPRYEEHPVVGRLEGIAMGSVNPGTGMHMMIAQSMNTALRHCKVGRVSCKTLTQWVRIDA